MCGQKCDLVGLYADGIFLQAVKNTCDLFKCSNVESFD
jgi:hypothetical protein